MRPTLSVLAAVPMVAVPMAAVAVLSGAAAHDLVGNRPTTALDEYNTVIVDGHKALSGQTVARRIKARYLPLPQLGRALAAVSCPARLKAVAGTRLICTARSGGKRVSIPVTVLRVSDRAITWTFRR